ncbi:S-layer homology domain-containing protein [Paenibacillus chartarius]|uniref:S-layer homology domain-containing protein n=1 Tax=Paenibacillus chartarius TaxID=747481 RepID=A0ABV6DLP7_9BACL
MNNARTRNRIGKQIIAILLVVALCLPIGGNLVFADNMESGELTVKNDFLGVSVNKQTGRFSIKTEAGSPHRANDNGKPLLFLDETPDTSFTTFRIDGKDYIYGNGYGFLGLSGGFTMSPTNPNEFINQSVWKAEGIEIIQTLTIVNDDKNPNVGNVKVSYKVKNTTNKNVAVGSRILLDTMLGPVDASPITVPGRQDYIRTETTLEGANLPSYWKAVDNPTNPRIMSYGFLNGWGNKVPNRMTVAHWNGIADTKWDYTPDASLDFTSSTNKFGSADSAVAVYWDPSTLIPGGEEVFETYYGLGSFFTSQKQAKYQLQINAPKQLTLNDNRDGYKEQYFNVTVDIDNSIDNAETLEGVTAVLGLPAELELMVGERRTVDVGKLEVGQSRTVTWKVKGKPQFAYKAAPIQAIVQASGGEESIQASYIVLPALSGKPPEVQVLEALPKRMYMKDKDPVLTLQGKGFDALRATSDWNVRVVRDRDGAEVVVPTGDVTILNDKQVQVRLSDDLWPPLKNEPGVYRVKLSAGVYGTFEKKIELTEEEKYKSRNYGILLVVGENISPERDRLDQQGQETYSLVPVENEEKLKQLKAQYAGSSMKDDKVALLEIRGSIRTIAGEDGIYEIGSGATINSVIRFDSSDKMAALFGESSQKMTISKHADDNDHDGDFIELSGNGVLSIPGFPFTFGPFGIELEDGTRYALDASEDNEQEPIEIEWEVLKGLSLVQQMGFFSVEMKNAIVHDQSVSFGGSVSMSFNPGTSKKSGDTTGQNPPTNPPANPPTNPPTNPPADGEEDEEEPDDFGLGLALDEARFGLREKTDLFGKAGTFGFLGLRAEGSAGLPNGMVPGLDFGATGRVLLDTFDRKFEIEADVEFQVVEVYGLLTLRFTESGVPIPDNFVFSVGAEPGIPLIPVAPVAYITKGGGGFRNMYDTLMGNFNILPPLKLQIIGGLSIAKVVTADNVTMGLSMRGLEFSGEFEILRFKLLKEVYGSLLLKDSLNKFGATITAGAKLSAFDVIEGEVYIVFDFDSSRSGLFGPIYMAGGGSVRVVIPRKIPLVGGLELASAQGEISTEKIWGKAKIIGIPIGFQYVWGDSAPRIGSNGLVEGALPERNGLGQKYYFNEDGAVGGMIGFGTNIKPVSSSALQASPAKADGRAVSILSGSHTYDIPVPSQEIALMEFTYAGDAPPVLEVKDPNGNEYKLEENENMLVQVIEAEESESGTKEKRVFVSIQQPMAGDWTVTSDQPLGWSLMDVEVPPSLTSVTAVKTADREVKVNWVGDHATDEKVSLFIATDNEKDPGRLIASDLDVAAGTATIALPEGLPSGSYYIKATLSKDGTNYDSRYSTETLATVNPLQPASPGGVKAEPAGNGVFQVSWTAPQEVDGYTIQLLDQDGNAMDQVGTVDVEATALSANVGGVMDSVYGEKVGLVPGASYKVSIASYVDIGDNARLYSEPATTDAVALPVPNPAAITLEALTPTDAPITNTFGEGEGQKTWLTNESTFRLKFDADQDVSTIVHVNNQLVGTFTGSDWTQSIPLEEGTNLIDVFAKNAAGDTTLTGLRVFSDVTKPDLKMESPSIVGDEMLVKGQTEPGTLVTVNGEAVQPEADGRFSKQLSMEGKLMKSLEVTAKDGAGNETVYTTEAMNSVPNSFERVEVRPVDLADDAAKPVDAISLQEGETKALQLIGIDADNKEYVIDPGSMSWSILAGDPYGSISEQGVAEAGNEGEFIIKASYSLSNEYALEDTITVNVLKSTGTDPGETPVDPEPGDWYVPPSESDSDSDAQVDRANQFIDQTMQNILKRLIEAEQDVKFLKSAQLAPNQSATIPIDERATINIPAQPLQSDVGLGIGTVSSPGKYVPEGSKLIGSIYEFKFDKPVKLTKPAELTLRFSLEEIPDPGKAAVYWYNERTKKWEYFGGTVNPAAGTITVQLPHFSKYALMVNDSLKDFTDMRGRWSAAYVNRLVSVGAIDGEATSSGPVFQPERAITRQEFLKIVVQAVGAKKTSAVLPSDYTDKDLVASWALSSIATAVANKWVNGTQKDSGVYIDPAASITRAEAIAIIGRILKTEASAGSGSASQTADSAAFTDASAIPAWASEHVAELLSRRILEGYEDGSLRPGALITREEAAKMISSVIDAIYEAK